MKIRKELCGEKEDIFVGSFYVSPEGKKSDKKTDFFVSMNKELNTFRHKGVVLVQGDLNARTGNEIDFISGDKSDDILGIENFVNQALATLRTQIRILGERTYLIYVKSMICLL